MKLSVIIPVYGPWPARRVIEAVLPLNPHEILVCDSSPVPTPLPNHPAIRLIQLKERAYPGAARNAGWRVAEGDYLLFVDADVVLTEQAVRFVERHISKDAKDMAFGLYTTDCADYNGISRFIARMQRYRFWNEFSKHHYRYGQSSHLLLRKELHREIGYFNPHLRMHEDKEICIRAVHAGIPVNVYPEFSADHLKIYSFFGLLKDHAQKTYFAIETKLSSPAIFNKVQDQFNAVLKACLIAAFTVPALLLLLVLFGFLPWPLAAAGGLVNFLSPLGLCRETFSESPWREKAHGLVLWPFMGISISLGALAAAIVVGTRTLLRWISDLGQLMLLAKRVLIRNGMPISIVHFVTARCNLRCGHCFYKETLDLKDPGEPSIQQLEKTTREIGPVLWYALGGGEPFLRDDLDVIHRVIASNCKPRMITIPTNGWYTDRTYLKTLQILQQMDGASLGIQISIDGPREVHDGIRGEGSWDRLQKTYAKLKQLRALYPALSLGIITVVNLDNYHVYPAFIDELVEAFEPNQISVNLVRHTTVGGPPVPIPVVEAYKNATERYGWHVARQRLKKFSYFGGGIIRAKESIQRDLIYRVARFDEFVTPCTAGSLTYVIWEDGRVNPCEMLPESIGNAVGSGLEGDFRNIVRNAQARRLRRKIVEEKCRCSYECAMTVNTLFSWPIAKTLWMSALAGRMGDEERRSNYSMAAK